ncbi:unnamed protein product [Rotaria sp. Silwood2]|nr:unnamed protein product [Rotaria sp. Silwood2]
MLEIHAQDKDKNNQIIYYIHPNDLNSIKNLIELKTNGSLYTKIKFNQKQINKFQFRIIANDSLYTDIILIEILIDNNILLKPQTPYCFILNNNENIRIQFQAYKNVSFFLRNPSSSDIILFPNGTLILKSIINKYSFDIYLEENNYSAIFTNFILLIQFKCENYHFIQFYQQIIFISLICFIIFIIIIIVCSYIQHKIEKKSFEKKSNIKQSFSLSLNDIFLFSCSSPQLTPMTITSMSTHQQINNSSTLSTYIKLSHSLQDETI